MLTVTAAPKILEGAGYGQLGETKGGHGKPRHLRSQYIPMRRHRSDNSIKRREGNSVSTFAPGMGRAIDIYA